MQRPKRSGGERHPTARPAPPAAPGALPTLTLDGGLLGTGQEVAAASSKARGAGSHGARQSRKPGAAPPSPPKPAARPDPIYADAGESEDAYIGALRAHFTRHGTAESLLPALNRKLPTTAYAWGLAQEPPTGALAARQAGSGKTRAAAAPGRTCSRGGGRGGSGGGPPLERQPSVAGLEKPAARGRLQQQEHALWEERERELEEAQEARLHQLRETLQAREGKREAYLLHRLHAAAADKVAQHAQVRAALDKERRMAAQHAQRAQKQPPAAGAGALPPPLLRHASSASSSSGGGGRAGQVAPLASKRSATTVKLAAALESVGANMSTPQGLEVLEAGLLSRNAFSVDAGQAQATAEGSGTPGAAPDAGARVRLPALGGAGRPTWQQRQQAALSVHLAAVQGQVAGQRAGGGRALHPLEAAQLAAIQRERRGSGRVHLPPVTAPDSQTLLPLAAAGAALQCCGSVAGVGEAAVAAGEGGEEGQVAEEAAHVAVQELEDAHSLEPLRAAAADALPASGDERKEADAPAAEKAADELAEPAPPTLRALQAPGLPVLPLGEDQYAAVPAEGMHLAAETAAEQVAGGADGAPLEAEEESAKAVADMSRRELQDALLVVASEQLLALASATLLAPADGRPTSSGDGTLDGSSPLLSAADNPEAWGGEVRSSSPLAESPPAPPAQPEVGAEADAADGGGDGRMCGVPATPTSMEEGAEVQGAEAPGEELTEEQLQSEMEAVVMALLTGCSGAPATDAATEAAELGGSPSQASLPPDSPQAGMVELPTLELASGAAMVPWAVTAKVRVCTEVPQLEGSELVGDEELEEQLAAVVEEQLFALAGAALRGVGAV